MRRALLFAAVFASGVGVGWVVRGETGKREATSPLPAVDFTRPFVVRGTDRLDPGRSYRPYGVAVDGKSERLGDKPSDDARCLVLIFDGGRFQVSAGLVD